MEAVEPGDLVELIGLVPAALLLLDEGGQVVFANPAAGALLKRQAILSVKDGTLSARRKGEHKALHEALAALAPGKGSVVCLRSREGLPVIAIDLHRLRSGVIAMRVTDLADPQVPSPERLKGAFGLTPAEARVAAALLAGLGLTAIARQNGVEAETVRTQAKRIRSKTGARSQNQVLGMFAAIGVDFIPR